MPKRIVLVSTAVVRGDKRVYPELNEPYDFTTDEIETINRLHPGGLRKPINETATDTDSGTAGSGAKSPGKSNQSAPGGSAKPTANKAPPKQKAAEQRSQASSEDAADEKNGEIDEDLVADADEADEEAKTTDDVGEDDDI